MISGQLVTDVVICDTENDFMAEQIEIDCKGGCG